MRYAKALRVVEARLRQIHATGDPRLALGDEAGREAAELAGLADTRTDTRAAHALGWLYWCRYLADYDNHDDLERALVLFRPVFRTRPSSVPPEVAAHYRHDEGQVDEVETATGQAIDRMEAYWRTGKLAELTAAVGYFRGALDACPEGRPEVLSNLSAALRELYERTRELELLRQAAELGRRAVALVPADHPDHTRILSNLGTTLHTLSEQTGDAQAAEEAVEALRAAVSIAGKDHPERAGYLSNLGAALRQLYYRTGEVSLLEEAARVLGEAVQALRPDEADQHKALASWSAGLLELFTHTGSADYLQAAVAAARRAVAALPAGHPDRAGTLSGLAIILRRQAGHDGRADTLGEAVAVLREAVTLTPAPHANRAAYLTNLANSLRDLFVYTGQTALLEQAIAATEEAAELTPAGHSARAAFLTSLSGAHLTMFERTGQDVSLRAAVKASRNAVAEAEPGNPNRAMYLSNLGLALLAAAREYVEAGPAADAVRQLREAVRITPEGHTGRGLYQDLLGTALRLLAGLNAVAPEQEASAILAGAAAAGRSAVEATPATHFLRDRFRFNLAQTLLALFEATGDAAVLTEARDCFMVVARSAAAAPLLRLRAYRGYAGLPDGAAISPDEALAALESAVELLPQAVPRWLTRDDRERDVGEIAGLPAQAAAAAVAAGHPVRAVELLEQTRGILVADILDARSGELARLRGRDRDLAAELEALRQRIAALDRDPGSWSEPDRGASLLTPEAMAAARQQADADWHDLLARIRSIEGLRDFLRLDHIDLLAAAAAEGPVAYVYATESRCDALILTGSAATPVRLVALPLTFGEAVERVSQFHEALAALGGSSAQRRKAESAILGALSWLWDRIAGPVLDDLDHQPRVWWCPIGFLAGLPLHAAGHHDDARSALDRVVSSYTPTARALISARIGRASGGDPPAGAVIVAVPDAPGTRPLAGVSREVSEISALLPGARCLDRPDRATVLAALRDYPVAHFACHGATDLHDPSSSKLVLHDHDTAPLTVGLINALELTHAELAYLSACETSVTSIGLADESVHITAAFYLAGYQQVIGTLWPIADDVACDIAVGFYQRLISAGAWTSRGASALNTVTRDIRDSSPGSPSLWAAHLHTGI